LEGVFLIDLEYFIDEVEIQHAGDEAGADALDFVGAGLEGFAGFGLGEDGALDGFDGDGFEGGLAGLEGLGDAVQGAPGADAGDEDIDGAVGVAPDFLAVVARWMAGWRGC